MSNYNPTPYTPGMSEEANEARIALNEFAWVKACIDEQYDTIEALNDRLATAETILRGLQDEADFRYAQLTAQGLIKEGEEV